MDIQNDPGMHRINTDPGNHRITESALQSSQITETVSKFNIHPLLCLNIVDHIHRARCNSIIPLVKTQQVVEALSKFREPPILPIPANAGTFQDPRVIGAVLGMMSGQSVEFFTSFELDYHIDPTTQTIKINFDFLSNKAAEYKKMFPSFTVLGWYSSTNHPEILPWNGDEQLNAELAEYIDNPIYCLYNTQPGKKPRQLRFKIYETQMRLENNTQKVSLIPNIDFQIVTEDAERIAFQQVSTIQPPSATRHQLWSFICFLVIDHLKTLSQSVGVLQSKLEIFKHFLVATKQGTIPYDHEMLIKVSTVISQLKSLERLNDSDKSTPNKSLAKLFNQSFIDGAIVALLNSSMKQVSLSIECFKLLGCIKNDLQDDPTN